MNNNPFERGPTRPDNMEDNNPYHQYSRLGGIINEKDYESALARAKNTTALDKAEVRQAERIANFSGIELHNAEDTIDQRIILYGILRSDAKPEEIEHHHSQMSDQRLFAEALRMLGDIDSLNKLIKAYPNISFNYHEEDENKKAA